MSAPVWETNVSELLTIFRDALRALIPYLEAARIRWRDDEAYEDWDDIAETLFERFVLMSIRWGLPNPQPDLKLPGYGFVYDDYSDRALIEVRDRDAPQEVPLVFFRLATRTTPLDTAKCFRADGDGHVFTSERVDVAFDRAFFYVKLQEKTDLEQPLSDLRVQL